MCLICTQTGTPVPSGHWESSLLVESSSGRSGQKKLWLSGVAANAAHIPGQSETWASGRLGPWIGGCHSSLYPTCSTSLNHIHKLPICLECPVEGLHSITPMEQWETPIRLATFMKITPLLCIEKGTLHYKTYTTIFFDKSSIKI